MARRDVRSTSIEATEVGSELGPASADPRLGCDRTDPQVRLKVFLVGRRNSVRILRDDGSCYHTYNLFDYGCCYYDCFLGWRNCYYYDCGSSSSY